MPKKLKAIIPAVLLVASITGGTYYYTHNNSINNSTSSNLLYYSASDLNKATSELAKLKVRTYSDVSWGKNGREKYFKGWQNAYKYNYQNVPKQCKVNYAILIFQAVKITYTDKCIIISGEWQSPYTNNYIFTKSDIEIDHIVPLKNVWDSGGNTWEQKERISYANAENNLLISEETLNSSKGNKSPDKWLPPENKCGYVIKWIKIKYNYKLTITISEKEMLAKKIKSCS